VSLINNYKSFQNSGDFRSIFVTVDEWTQSF